MESRSRLKAQRVAIADVGIELMDINEIKAKIEWLS